VVAERQECLVVDLIRRLAGTGGFLQKTAA
jgi:hypothetical protein